MWLRTLALSLVIIGVKTLLTEHDSWKRTIWNPESRTIEFTFDEKALVNNTIVDWGLTIPDGTEGTSCAEGDECLDYGVAKVVVTRSDNCEEIHWTTSDLIELKDCIIVSGHWYGGGAQFNEPWPLEKVPRIEMPYVTSDFLYSSDLFGGMMETYWISSQGVSALVDENVPLFFSMPDNDDDGTADQMCFSSKYQEPFQPREPNSSLNLTYHLCYADDVRQVYESSFNKFFNTPTGIPDEDMFRLPVWSTWAEFSVNIDQEKVLSMAQTIIDEGFNYSQIEIDDNWETCYGNHEFNTDKFPDTVGMVDTLHSLGFRVTLWIHPFINDDCESFAFADSSGFFVKNESGVTQLTSWWQGSEAGYIDFTNPDAVSWWSQRIVDLKMETGIDSFKFDAGETSWLPDVYTLNADKSLWPNVFTSSYVNEVSKFGNLIETRVGHRNTEKSIFIRMLDKFSDWSYGNGLKTMVPSLLHQGIIGYPFVLPDMVGGNGYGGDPNDELFIRWAQANTFMPAIQFSILPWGYEGDTATNVARDVSALHLEYVSTIIDLAQNATEGQGPMMRPTWWLCPNDEDCLTADQQFLLGDNILVTPVVEEGATTLDVVIPPGSWQKQDDGTIYFGVSKETLTDINIESNIYFKRV